MEIKRGKLKDERKEKFDNDRENNDSVNMKRTKKKKK